MHRIEAQQEAARNGSSDKPSSESGTAGGYKCQSELEAELATLQAEIEQLRSDKEDLHEEVQNKDRELEAARQNITALAQRVNQAEAFELAYRRKADTLGAQLAAARQRAEF